MDLKNLNSFFKAVTPRREPKRTQRALLLENLRSIQVEIDNQGGRDGVIARAGLMAAQTERAADFDEEQRGTFEITRDMTRQYKGMQ